MNDTDRIEYLQTLANVKIWEAAGRWHLRRDTLRVGDLQADSLRELVDLLIEKETR